MEEFCELQVLQILIQWRRNFTKNLEDTSKYQALDRFRSENSQFLDDFWNV